MVYFGHIAQVTPEESLCIGCQSCNLVCGLIHDGVVGPMQGRIKIGSIDYKQLIFEINSCQQCTDYPCYYACPKKNNAMCIDEELGIAYVNEENCIGCGLCAKNCKFSPARIIIDPKKRKAKKCDMCRTREGGPACIEYCPVQCLILKQEE